MGAAVVDGTEADLQRALQKENQRQWLLAAKSAGRQPGRIIRKRRTGQSAAAPEARHLKDPVRDRTASAERSTGRPIDQRPPRKSAPPKPAPVSAGPQTRQGAQSPRPPVFDRTQNVAQMALRRAAGVCDLCDRRAAADDAAGSCKLEAYRFAAPRADEAVTIKNVAALCPECLKRVGAGCLPADAKKLARRARSKLISQVAVTTRGRGARPATARIDLSPQQAAGSSSVAAPSDVMLCSAEGNPLDNRR